MVKEEEKIMSEAAKTKKKLSIPVKLAIALVLGAIAGPGLQGEGFVCGIHWLPVHSTPENISVPPGAVQHHRRYRKRGGHRQAEEDRRSVPAVYLHHLRCGRCSGLFSPLPSAARALVWYCRRQWTPAYSSNMVDSIVGWVPDNVFASLANGTLVQIIVLLSSSA